MGGDWVDDQKFIELERRVDKLEYKSDGIEKRLDKIDGNLNKIMWILVTAVVLAILNSVFKGGVVS